MGILTGVLRVAKESLFSTFNNVNVFDVMSKGYGEYFGFTKDETKELLEYYGLELTLEVSNMYDGYNIDGIRIYNPWSILKYANSGELKPYWINTGSNNLVKDLLINLKEDEIIRLESLLKNESITFKYREGLNQMKEKEYYKELVLDKVNNIKEYVIVFCGKKANVR